MASTREGPNPLRPYYIPPSIGLPLESTASMSSGARAFGSKNGTATAYAPSTRDIFSDIDYSEYVSKGSQTTLDMIKALLDQAMYKYLSVLLAQPFDVAKTVLQVRSQESGDGSIPLADTEDMRSGSRKDSMYGDPKYASDESDPDEPSYFTSSAPSSSSYSPSRSRRRHITDRSGYVIPSSSSYSSAVHRIILKRPDSIIEVISQLWTAEGGWGVWKGTNATFVYSILLKTIETWSRSMIAAIVNVPDPGGIAGLGFMIDVLDVVDSPYPWVSLGVAVGAAAMAGLILAPLDIVRTKLIMTTTSAPKRGFLQNIKLLPSFTCPPSLILPTVIHSMITPLMTHSSRLLLRSRLAIDPVLTPTSYSVAAFCSSSVELFLKLPIETVLRRGQMSIVSSPKYIGAGKLLEPIVEVGAYRGPLGTMWMIIREEGISYVPESAAVKNDIRGIKKSGKSGERKGQGIEGLWRGWRVGFWGLVGMWGASILGGAGGGEF